MPNTVHALLAATPLIVVIAALLFRQSSLHAAIFGAIAAGVVGALWFNLTAAHALDAAANWWPLVCEVLVIVWAV